jgi:hypothetical protein
VGFIGDQLMIKHWSAFVLLLLAASAADAWGQRSTERYVPIGRSPGLSGKHTVIGTVESVNMESRTLTCVYDSITVRVRCTDKTRIWLDRSKTKLTNIAGSLKDCRQGMLMEVKFVDNDRKTDGVADWIKVAVGGEREK